MKPQTRTEPTKPVDALRDLVDEIASHGTVASDPLDNTHPVLLHAAPPGKTKYTPINRVQAVAYAPMTLLGAR